MTILQYKNKKHHFTPALWMKARDINFHMYTAIINDEIFPTYSLEFAKKYEQDRLIRILQE